MCEITVVGNDVLGVDWVLVCVVRSLGLFYI